MGNPAPQPRTADDFVEDLHTLLGAAGEHPPYLLVGHSAGGVLVRAYQKRHPGEVASLILVDTATQYLVDRWSGIPERMVTSWAAPAGWRRWG